MKKIFVLFLFLFSFSILFAQEWKEIIKNTVSDGSVQNYYGYSVAIDGDYAVVSATNENTDAAGSSPIDGAAAAYVLYRNQGGTNNWGEVKKLVPDDRHEDDYFVWSVSISNDIIVAGTFRNDYDSAGNNYQQDAGAAYVFRKLIQASDLVFRDVETDRFSLGWTNGNGTSRAVFIKEGSSGGAQPEDGISYAANQTFGSGSQIASTGWYCVCNGTSSGTDIYGLKPGTTYRVSVCEYINDPGSEIYSTQSATSNPSNQPTQVKDTHTFLIGIITNSAGDGTGGNGYGYSVSVDGDYAVVGAPYEGRDAAGGNAITSAGAAYILYRHQGGADQWGEITGASRKN
jgi:hypothetical protein